jgi:hypothetical protein
MPRPDARLSARTVSRLLLNRRPTELASALYRYARVDLPARQHAEPPRFERAYGRRLRSGAGIRDGLGPHFGVGGPEVMWYAGHGGETPARDERGKLRQGPRRADVVSGGDEMHRHLAGGQSAP